jgi:phosphoglycolate phosphatase
MDEYIEDFENFGRTGKGKSDNIRLIVERNQLDQAVYIGDIQGDFDSTREAGLPFIHARYGFGIIDEEVPYINGLKELPEVVEQIFEK